MRGVPTRPADVGRRQFRPRIGLVRARKRCCARRRRRKKSRRRGRRATTVCVPFDYDLPRADKIYNSLLARVVRSRGILLLFRFVSLRSPFDKLVASLGVSDPRSFEGDPDSGGVFGVNLKGRERR